MIDDDDNFGLIEISKCGEEKFENAEKLKRGIRNKKRGDVSRNT